MNFKFATILLLSVGILSVATSAQDVVTTAAQVQGLSIETAALGKTVRLEGVMTFIDSASGRAFMQRSRPQAEPAGRAAEGLAPG